MTESTSRGLMAQAEAVCVAVLVLIALTVSGAFPSGSMVTAACPVTGILVVSFLVRMRAGDISLARWWWWLVDEKRMK